MTAYNLTKPYHIDDTAHLIIAQWIQHHPLHPMSGPLNWSGTTQPIYHTNQPHLYFDLLALWGGLFGYGEIEMHALQSLFAAACIAFFYRLARALAPSHALWLTAMLALNPAFIVEQNLMVDVPLLSCWLSFFVCLCCYNDTSHQNRRFGLAAIACSAALLIKYSSLALIPILVFALIRERRLRQAWCVVIPGAALLAWSAFNLYDYGGIHLATVLHASAATYHTQKVKHHHFLWLQKHRPVLFDLIISITSSKILNFSLSWVVGLGALTPFGIVAFTRRFPRAAKFVYPLCLAGLAGLALAAGTNHLSSHAADHILFAGFLINGLLAALSVWPPRKDLQISYLQAWIVITSLFYILASPFIAARHILLILPAISLLVAVTGPISRPAKIYTLLLTVILSAGLCMSDFRFASIYKLEAETMRASLPPNSTIWAAGHWGWQYYAAQNGLKELDVGAGLAGAIAQCPVASGPAPGGLEYLELNALQRQAAQCKSIEATFQGASPIKPGDYIVVPVDVDHQLPTNLFVLLIRTDHFNMSKYDPFCSSRPVRFYSFGALSGPWSLSSQCSSDVTVVQAVK